jgi:nitroimidazol reductase NimA-like FMN-containing flavoprotein (pyridoxamine 5'-phosphate oxidase superfamily)
MNEDYLIRAKKIIQTINYATIATVSKNGYPWNSPVAHSYDSGLNIYWFSDKNNQHSRNVRDNSDVFIVIYDSTIQLGKGEGVYIKAKASELKEPEEITKARKLKKGPDYDGLPDEFMGEAVRRVYKATPLQIWMNDAEIKDGVFIRDYRIKISLSALTELLK